LLRVLMRLDAGDKDVCRIVNVPSEPDEDARRLHRERDRLKKEVTQLRNRILGLLATEGLRTDPDRVSAFLKTARTPDGRELGPSLKREIERMHARLDLLNKQLLEVEKEQQSDLRRQKGDPKMKQVAMLMCLCGIGIQGAWQLVMEFFGWRRFQNRRQVGALAGLTGTPYNSGKSQREQGISKAGNKRIRRLLVELAWLWLRHQPNSALSLWYAQRYGKTSTRSRKVGIVALARKLLVALWHFVESGAIPTGARLSPSRGVDRGLVDELRLAPEPAMGYAS
jgi:transposase